MRRASRGLNRSVTCPEWLAGSYFWTPHVPLWDSSRNNRRITWITQIPREGLPDSACPAARHSESYAP